MTAGFDNIPHPTAPAETGLTIFLSYAEPDEQARKQLELHLAPHVKSGRMSLLHRGQILAGDDLAAHLPPRVDASTVIVMLLSASYLADGSHALERDRALARHAAGWASIVPVRLSSVQLRDTAFAGLQLVPRTSAVMSKKGRDRDGPWAEVVAELLEVAERRRSSWPPPQSAVLVPSVHAPSVHVPPLAPPPAHFAPQSGPGSIAPSTNVPFNTYVPPSVVVREASEIADKLGAAQERLDHLMEAGADHVTLTSVNDEILDLKRRLRAAGTLKPGDILGGRFVLKSQLGKGGFATVWRATDRREGRDVAIKVLRPELAVDRIRRDRFIRGARVMRRLAHPHIVSLFDEARNDEGWYFYPMELVTGGTLADAVLGRGLARDEVLRVLLRVGAALRAVHEGGWMHRDIKPANVLLAEDGTPKLTDFDLVGGPATTGGTAAGGGPLGTFGFAAPELNGDPTSADVRADVWSLGMTAVSALHGRSWPEQVRHHERAQDLVDSLPCEDAIKRVLRRAVQRDPELRYRDAGELCDALDAAIDEAADDDEPDSAGPRTMRVPLSDPMGEPRAARRAPNVEVVPAAQTERPPADLDPDTTARIRDERVQRALESIGRSAADNCATVRTVPEVKSRPSPLLDIRDAYFTVSRTPGPLRGKDFRLRHNPTTIGRCGEEGMILLPSPEVSRIHARVELRGFSLVVVDEGSLNHTFVIRAVAIAERERVVGATVLNEGDEVALGMEYRLLLRFDERVRTARYRAEVARRRVDPATDLASELSLRWRLEQETLSARLKKQNLAFALVRVSARDGAEPVPDAALAEVARQIEGMDAVDPPEEMIGRVGPAEIGVILPMKTAAEATARLSPVREAAPANVAVHLGAVELLAGDEDGTDALLTRARKAIRG